MFEYYGFRTSIKGLNPHSPITFSSAILIPNLKTLCLKESTPGWRAQDRMVVVVLRRQGLFALQSLVSAWEISMEQGWEMGVRAF